MRQTSRMETRADAMTGRTRSRVLVWMAAGISTEKGIMSELFSAESVTVSFTDGANRYSQRANPFVSVNFTAVISGPV